MGSVDLMGMRKGNISLVHCYSLTDRADIKLLLPTQEQFSSQPRYKRMFLFDLLEKWQNMVCEKGGNIRSSCHDLIF